MSETGSEVTGKSAWSDPKRRRCQRVIQPSLYVCMSTFYILFFDSVSLSLSPLAPHLFHLISLILILFYVYVSYSLYIRTPLWFEPDTSSTSVSLSLPSRSPPLSLDTVYSYSLPCIYSTAYGCVLQYDLNLVHNLILKHIYFYVNPLNARRDSVSLLGKSWGSI